MDAFVSFWLSLILGDEDTAVLFVPITPGTIKTGNLSFQEKWTELLIKCAAL